MEPVARMDLWERQTRAIKMIDVIARRAADRHGLTLPMLIGRSRCRKIVQARHEAMVEAVRAGYGTAATGRYFDRDHTTVIHALKKLKAI